MQHWLPGVAGEGASNKADIIVGWAVGPLFDRLLF